MAERSTYSVEEVLTDSQLMLNTMLSRKDRTSRLFSWKIRNYSSLRKNVFYSRSSLGMNHTWKFRVMKARGTLFTVLLSKAVNQVVYFSLISNMDVRLLSGRSAEIADGTYVAEFCRKTIEKGAFLKDDVLIVQCKIHLKLDNERMLVLPYNQPRDSTDVFQLCKDFRELLLEQQFTDFSIESDCYEFFDVHKAVLIARSPFFEKFFEEDMSRTSIHVKACPSAINEVLVYMYCGEFKLLDPPVMCEVMNLAKMFKLSGLAQKCEDFFDTQLTPEKVMQIMDMASTQGLVELKNIAVRYMVNHFGMAYEPLMKEE